MHLGERYLSVRSGTEALTRPLSDEDCALQPQPEVSPPKWHLAHTTWFFETFVLKPFEPSYKSFDDRFHFLFNSYYKGQGRHLERSRRGTLSRPALSEIYRYRATVDERILKLISSLGDASLARLQPVLTLGLHHEQQHQELLCTDIQAILSTQPFRPVYKEGGAGKAPAAISGWQEFGEGLFELGFAGGDFHFDNEAPRHRVYLNPFRIERALVTNRRYLDFMEDRGYERPELWLSEGFDFLLSSGARSPLYWQKMDGRWFQSTLRGTHELDPEAPVSHLSYFEADAFSRWSGARLPTEAEWERASQVLNSGRAGFLESGELRPSSAAENFGQVWQWTSSAYLPYPGFVPFADGLGEYNGKFMCNQMVLRGGSCATPRSHFRPTYRNFFPANARWQFTGLRLAASIC